MATERIPTGKYRRRLKEIEDELDYWIASYIELGRTGPDRWWNVKYDERAAVLQDAQRHMRQARETLLALPRVS